MKQRQGNSADTEVTYPLGAGPGRIQAGRFPLALVTIPGAALYRVVSQSVRRSQLARRSAWPGVTVISVGNLEVGGNGKTPFARVVIERLVGDGHQPVYISRGFKSESEKIRPVTVVAPDDNAPPGSPNGAVRWARRDTRSLSRSIGDEGAMIAAQCPGIALLFSADKRRAIETAIDLFKPSHVILDDAFQTWRLHRDMDIVLLDARRPFGNGRLIPAGTLRESPDALARASVVGLNGIGAASDLDAFADTLYGLVGRNVPLFGLRRGMSLVDSSGAQATAPTERITALCSIARPESFDEALAGCGCDVAVSLRYPDHHRYRREDLLHIENWMEKKGCTTLVTTEKDWAKLREMSLPFGRILVGRLGVSVEGLDIGSCIEKAAD